MRSFITFSNYKPSKISLKNFWSLSFREAIEIESLKRFDLQSVHETIFKFIIFFSHLNLIRDKTIFACSFETPTRVSPLIDMITSPIRNVPSYEKQNTKITVYLI